MTKNEQLNEELYGHDFEVYRVDHKSNPGVGNPHDDVGTTTSEESSISTFDDIEEAFDKVEQVSRKIGQLRRKKNSKSDIVYEATDYGTIVIENGTKIASVLIRELKREQVS